MLAPLSQWLLLASAPVLPRGGPGAWARVPQSGPQWADYWLGAARAVQDRLGTVPPRWAQCFSLIDGGDAAFACAGRGGSQTQRCGRSSGPGASLLYPQASAFHRMCGPEHKPSLWNAGKFVEQRHSEISGATVGTTIGTYSLGAIWDDAPCLPAQTRSNGE